MDFLRPNIIPYSYQCKQTILFITVFIASKPVFFFHRNKTNFFLEWFPKMEFLNITGLGSKRLFKKNPQCIMVPLSARDSSYFQKILPKYIVRLKCLRRMAVL